MADPWSQFKPAPAAVAVKADPWSGFKPAGPPPVIPIATKQASIADVGWDAFKPAPREAAYAVQAGENEVVNANKPIATQFGQGIRYGMNQIGKGIVGVADFASRMLPAPPSQREAMDAELARARDIYNQEQREAMAQSNPASIPFQAGAVVPPIAGAIASFGIGSGAAGVATGAQGLARAAQIAKGTANAASAARAASIARGAQILAGSGAASVIPAGETYTRAIEEGATPGTAMAEGATAFAANTAFNLIPGGQGVAGGGVRSFGRRLATGAGAGAIAGAGQQFVEDTAAAIGHGGQGPTVGRTLRGAGMGAVIGAGMAGLGGFDDWWKGPPRETVTPDEVIDPTPQPDVVEGEYTTRQPPPPPPGAGPQPGGPRPGPQPGTPPPGGQGRQRRQQPTGFPPNVQQAADAVGVDLNGVKFEDDLKEAVRAAWKRTHPDANKSPTAQQEFEAVMKASETLKAHFRGKLKPRPQAEQPAPEQPQPNQPHPGADPWAGFKPAPEQPAAAAQPKQPKQAATPPPQAQPTEASPVAFAKDRKPQHVAGVRVSRTADGGFAAEDAFGKPATPASYKTPLEAAKAFKEQRRAQHAAKIAPAVNAEALSQPRTTQEPVVETTPQNASGEESGIIPPVTPEQGAGRTTPPKDAPQRPGGFEVVDPGTEFRNDPEQYARALLSGIPKGKPGIASHEFEGRQQGFVFRNKQGQVVGVLKHDGKYITDIAVKKSERRKGIASQLTQAAKEDGVIGAKGPFTNDSNALNESLKQSFNPPAPAKSGGVPDVVAADGVTPPPAADTPSETGKGKEAWEVTRAEFKTSQNAPIVDAVKKRLQSGQPVEIRTQQRITRLTHPDHIRIAKDGSVLTRERSKWVTLVDSQVESIGSQSGIAPVPIEKRIYHRAEIEAALDAGKPVPPEVLADYPDLQPKPSPEVVAPESKPAEQGKPAPRSHAERVSADQPQFKPSWDKRRELLRNRINDGKIVTRKDLNNFSGEPWADEKLAAMSPVKKVSPEAMSQRRKELENELREEAAKDIGPDQVLRKIPHMLQVPVFRGEKSLGSYLPLDEAIEHAKTLPDDHPVRIKLHNLEELAKNPRGTKIVKVDTSQVPDGTQVVMNDKSKPLVIDKENGLLTNDITLPLPDDGVTLYGKKVLPPKEGEGASDDPFGDLPTATDMLPPKLSTGTLAAGGAVDMFEKPAFDAKAGEQEAFGFKQDDEAVKREQERREQERRALEPKQEKDNETGNMFAPPDKPKTPDPQQELIPPLIQTSDKGGNIEVSFPSIPSLEVRQKLKGAGFRWNPKDKVWYAKDTGATRAVRDEVSGGGDDTRAKIIAHHGSPRRDIEKFSTKYIGTGEGAQAFGWGLYYASKEELGKHYRDRLTTGRFYDLDGEIVDYNELENRLSQLLHSVETTEQATDAAFGFVADLRSGNYQPKEAAERMSRGLTPEGAALLKDFASGVQRPNRVDKPMYKAAIKGGRRQYSSLTDDEREAFWELDSRLYWQNPKLSSDDAVKNVRKQLDNTIEAQSKEAQYYQELIDNGSIADDHRNALTRAKGNLDTATKALELLNSGKVFARFEEPLGGLYKVELAPDEDELLDWDKPLSQQSEKVKTALRNAGIIDESDLNPVPDDQYTGMTDKQSENFQRYGRRFESGQDIYRGLEYSHRNSKTKLPVDLPPGDVFPQQAASQYLRSLGIRGIRYLDGSSRAAGEGSHNYVIFDEADINIIEKYALKAKGEYEGRRGNDSRLSGPLSRTGRENTGGAQSGALSQSGRITDQARTVRAQPHVKRISGGAKIRPDAAGFVIEHPNGHVDTVRWMDQPELVQRLGQDKWADSVVSHFAGDTLTTPDGVSFVVPDNASAVLALPTDQIDTIIANTDIAGLFRGGKILLDRIINEDDGDLYDTLHEEMWHSVFRRLLSPDQRRSIERVFVNDENAFKAIHSGAEITDADARAVIELFTSGRIYTERNIVVDMMNKMRGGERAALTRSGKIDPAILEAPVKLAANIASEAADVSIRPYSEPFINAMRRMGGKKGQTLATAGLRMMSRAKENYAQDIDVIDEGRDAVRKLSGTSTWLMRIGETAHGVGVRNIVGATEGEIGNVPAAHRPAVQKFRDANLTIGRKAQGIIPGFRATGRFQRNFTEYGMNLVLGPYNATKLRFVRWLAAKNGITTAGVRRILDSLADDVAGGNYEALTRRVNQEFRRELRHFPTSIQDGGWQDILHSNPDGYLARANRVTSSRMAFLQEFGDGGIETARQVIRDGRGDVAALDNMVKAIHEMPFDLGLTSKLAPAGTLRRKAANVGNEIAGTLKTVFLSGAAPLNAIELMIGSVPQSMGMRNAVRGAMRLIQGGERYRSALEARGMVDRAMYDWAFDPTRPVRSVNRMIRNAITEGSFNRFINELTEAHAAATADVLIDMAKSGQLSGWQAERMRVVAESMGFSAADAKRLSSGQASQAAYDAFGRRTAAFLSGGNRIGVEGSKFQASRTAGELLPFQSYGIKQMNQLAQYADTFRRALKDGDKKKAAAAAEVLARFAFGTVAQGAAQALWYAMLGGGLGLAIFGSEVEDEPAEFVAESFINGLGGPFSMIYRYATGSSFGKDITGNLFPVSAFGEVKDILSGSNAYRNQSPMERLQSFATKRVGGGRITWSVLAPWAMGQQYKDMETAERAYYRWRGEEVGRQTFTSDLKDDEANEKFRTAMRRAFDRMKANKPTDEVLDELRIALGAKDGDVNSLKASLRGRRLLRPFLPSEGDSQAELQRKQKQLDGLRKRIGERAFDVLIQRERIIEAWAEAI